MVARPGPYWLGHFNCDCNVALLWKMLGTVGFADGIVAFLLPDRRSSPSCLTQGTVDPAIYAALLDQSPLAISVHKQEGHEKQSTVVDCS